MRKSLLMLGIPVSVIGLGLAAYVGMRSTEKKSSDAFSNDLLVAQAAGLELAQAQGANRFALSETVPEAAPEPRTTIKRANGPKAVRSATPTVKAAPEAVAADVVEEIPALQAMQTASAPTQTEATAPAIPRPSPVNEPAPSQDEGPILAGGSGRGPGRTGNGGNGGGWGIFGAVIRGGGVDGDNCDPRPRSTAGRPPMRAPVYGSNPSGMGGGRTTVRPGVPVIGIVSVGGAQARPRGSR